MAVEGVVNAGYDFYSLQFYAALIAAVERRVTGAAAAYNTVRANVTNLSSWLAANGSDPRWTPATRINVAGGFAAGADPGSIVNNVWTPGKTAGVVNTASWDTVPKRQWVSVAGSRIDALEAQILAAVPGWQAWNHLNWDGVMNAWNGFAIDQIGSRVWLVSAGGHSDSPNNGIYRFDGSTMAWAVEHMPSDPSTWSAAYKNLSSGTISYTDNPESHTAWSAKLAAGTLLAVNDVFYDELPADQAPTSRHTYSSSVYDPTRDELLNHCRRTWRYSRQTGQWTERRFNNDQVNASFGGGENITATFDEVAGQSLITYSGGSNEKSIAFNHASSTWSAWNSPFITKNVCDARHGRTLTVFAPPTNDGPYAPNGDYWKYDLDARATQVSGTVQMTGGFSKSSFTTSFYDGSCLVYIPDINRYWGISKDAANAGVWFQLDPTTTPWTMSPLTFAPGAPVTLPTGVLAAVMERKLVYFPGLNAVILGRKGTTEMLIYRF
jgi:hypothetical protein